MVEKVALELDLFYRALSPRLVVVITTVDKQGRINAAPFSFFSPVSMEPPRVAFFTDPEHDTYHNVLETKEFVVNVPPVDIAEKVFRMGRRYPRGVNELEKVGLRWIPSLKVKPPRIVECVAHAECKVIKTEDVGDHAMVLGDVVAASANPGVMRGDVMDLSRARSLLHVGGKIFTYGEREIVVR